MIELTAARKNKITLSDYNYRRDIENRLLMSQFTELDFAVLEEILYSPIKVQTRKLARSLGITEEVLSPILEGFARTGLLTTQGDTLVVDKEMRKYWESEIAKFDPHFKPDMDFLQGLLRKVPIHVLPLWYAIPRTSNNIFESLIEKYLQTPQIYQRYLLELHLGDPALAAIVQDVFRSPQLKLPAKTLIDKYALSRDQFEEYMLHLEFNFLCCLGYEKEGTGWKEIVTPFHEWREYLSFLSKTAPRPVADVSKVYRFRPSDHSFVQDMTSILLYLKKQPVVLNDKGYAALASTCDELSHDPAYIDQIIRKLKVLKFADLSEGKLKILEHSREWLEMRLENRLIYLYRNAAHLITAPEVSEALKIEKNVREAEKSVIRVLHAGWITFEDFIQGVIVPVGDQPPVGLSKQGKNWRYVLPEYREEEKALIKATIFEYLFESGITAVGSYEGKDCFCVTPFGQTLFG